MTPWHLFLCAVGYNRHLEEIHDMNAWQMYHGAALTRSIEKMPKLSVFLSSNKKKVRGIDEVAIMEQLKAYQKVRKNGNSSADRSRPTS